MTGQFVPPKTRDTYRDAAGELGIIEGDHEPVFPDLGPDMHGYIARALLAAKIAGGLLAASVLFGLGLFIGWVLWGQS